MSSTRLIVTVATGAVLVTGAWGSATLAASETAAFPPVDSVALASVGSASSAFTVALQGVEPVGSAAGGFLRLRLKAGLPAEIRHFDDRLTKVSLSAVTTDQGGSLAQLQRRKGESWGEDSNISFLREDKDPSRMEMLIRTRAAQPGPEVKALRLVQGDISLSLPDRTRTLEMKPLAEQFGRDLTVPGVKGTVHLSRQGGSAIRVTGPAWMYQAADDFRFFDQAGTAIPITTMRLSDTRDGADGTYDLARPIPDTGSVSLTVVLSRKTVHIPFRFTDVPLGGPGQGAQDGGGETARDAAKAAP